MLVFNYHRTFDDIAKIFSNKYPEMDDNKVLLLGIDFLTPTIIEDFKAQGKEVWILQSEQLHTNSPWVNMKVFNLMSLADKILEYDQQNLIFYFKHFGHKTQLFDTWFDANLKWENKIQEPDIDVLFFGTLNERRFKYLANISDKLPTVKLLTVTNAWGTNLQQIINRSKIILNIHFYETSFIQEQIRLFPLLINNKCILSETSNINHFGKGIVECLAKDMPQFINELLKDDKWKLIQSAHIFENLSMCREMENSIKANPVELF